MLMRRNDFNQLASLYESVYVVNEANLASDQTLIAALDEALGEKGVGGASPISKWFKTQYLKWFKSPEGDDKKNVSQHQYTDGEPEWMSKEGIVDFQGFTENEKQKLSHMIDYFVSLDDRELATIYKEPYGVIVNKVAEWDRRLANKMSKAKLSPLVEGTDFKVIRKTQDEAGAPMKWVKLLTPAAFKFEGDAMGHCVGGYNPSKKGLDIISLYDDDNLPHVTLEIQNKEIRQIKGKQNAAPTATYQPPCYEFIKYLVESQGYTVTGDGDNIGMAHFENAYYFRDTPEWKNIYENKIVPMQQKAFDEIKKRIKVIATEGYEYAASYMYNLLKEKRTIW